MSAAVRRAPDIPILFMDTCSILDVMRDPTRDAMRKHDREAALQVIEAAENGNLEIVLAAQVIVEFNGHDEAVQADATNALQRVIAQLDQANALSGVYGRHKALDLSHLADLTQRSRAVVERLLNIGSVINAHSEIAARAFARSNIARAPARRGKDSTKDCFVFESYLQIGRDLRGTGHQGGIVFASSNTQEYQTESRLVKPEIIEDLDMIEASYAPNMNAARRFLGL